MADFLGSIKDRIEKSPWVIPLTILCGYITYLGIKFYLEDYNANIKFYETIPTIKAGGAVMIREMARFIQIAPIAFGYIFLRDTNKFMYGAVALFFLVVDWVIGTYYRSAGFTMGAGWNGYAAVEDFVFFTVGSEIVVVLFGGLTLSLVLASVRQVWAGALKGMGEHREGDKVKQGGGKGGGPGLHGGGRPDMDMPFPGGKRRE